METSKDWPGDDRSGGAEQTRSRRMQIQTSVGAIAVVVSRELPKQEVSTTSTRGSLRCGRLIAPFNREPFELILNTTEFEQRRMEMLLCPVKGGGGR